MKLYVRATVAKCILGKSYENLARELNVQPYQLKTVNFYTSGVAEKIVENVQTYGLSLGHFNESKKEVVKRTGKFDEQDTASIKLSQINEEIRKMFGTDSESDAHEYSEVLKDASINLKTYTQRRIIEEIALKLALGIDNEIERHLKKDGLFKGDIRNPSIDHHKSTYERAIRTDSSKLIGYDENQMIEYVERRINELDHPLPISRIWAHEEIRVLHLKGLRNSLEITRKPVASSLIFYVNKNYLENNRGNWKLFNTFNTTIY